MQQPAPVTPLPFFDTVMAFQRSAALKTAIELDIFTRIGAGHRTAGTLANAVGASERGVRILCDSLVVMNFLVKENGEYALNDLSATFLDRRSPAYAGGAVDFLMSDAQLHGFRNLTDSVRRGGADPNNNASISADSEMWVKFARGMAPLAFPVAQMTAANLGFPPEAELKILDIAAGHGLFGILAATQYPNAKVYAVDWGNVLAVANENAAKFGVGERYNNIEGDAFETDLGSGYDAILVPNFLHHFARTQCVEFLRRCYAALNDEGKVATVEFIPNDDRISPPMEAMFPLIMLAATPAGDAYTYAELEGMLKDAGFSRNEHIPLDPMPSHLVVSMK